MKEKFAWYLNSSPEQAKQAWENGVLTVDANVVLDLYRYHSATRDSILAAVEAFAPRVWISYQAAQEFFANRKNVIASAEKTFREANTAIDDLTNSLEGNVSKLRNYRLVPRPTIDEFTKALETAVASAQEQINEASKNHPNYLKHDPILDRLLLLFDGKIGEKPSEDDRAKLVQQGEARFKTKTPPGYMDDGKEGDRKYGDFLFWSELLEYAKNANVPIVLVTSEQKEDWWEKRSGKTLGPRMELIQEFAAATAQQIFIYQTDNFLKIAADFAGTSVTAEVVEEIREISARRTRPRLNPPAVDVEQLPHVADRVENLGTLEINLLREVFMMTGSGRFEPEMDSVPRVSVRVINAPDGCPPIDVTARTGTTFDFNVHIHSTVRDERLPVGHYTVEYEAISGGNPTCEASPEAAGLPAGPAD